MRSGFFAGLLLATVSTGAAFAQGAPIKLANVAELSGGGATVGNNWKNGIDLAIEEINAKGGLLGRKLEVTHADSQSNPGVARAQVQKALDNEPYVLLGPGYSGSVKVTSPLAAEAGITQIMEFVMSLCTRVMVMAEGKLLAMGTPAEVRANPAVIEAYLGH